MNLYRQLEALLPNQPLLVGTVIAHNGDGTSTLQLLDGSILRVRGQSVAVGAKAFSMAGEIQGAAPDLPVVSINI